MFERICIYIIFLFLISPPASAQKGVYYLGIEQGLSNDFVTKVFKDRNGFMWFGTFNGLNRFDGYEFEVFKNIPQDNQSLPDNRITDICEDKNGSLYVATKVGIAVLHKNGGNFRRVQIKRRQNQIDPIDFAIHQVTRDQSGLIWATSSEAGLLFLRDTPNGLLAQSVPLSRPNQANLINYNVNGLSITTDGTIWLSVHNVGICWYDQQYNCVRVKIPYDQWVNYMATSADGDIWLSTNSGINRYNPKSDSFTYYTAANGLGRERIVLLYLGKDQKIWICSDGGGMQKIDPQTGKIEAINQINEHLTSNSVSAVYEDSQCRTWIGTLRGGINIFDPNKGKFQLVKNTLENRKISANNFILSLEEADQNNLWIGTDGSGLLKWNREKQLYLDYPLEDPSLLKSSFITGLVQEDKDWLWISTYDRGIFRFHIKSGKIKPYPCLYPGTKYTNQVAWRLYKDDQQRIFASTLNGGQVYLLDKKSDAFVPLNVPIYDVLSFMTENQDVLWMGSWSKIVRLNIQTKQYKEYQIGTPARFILKDNDERFLWIGTEGGGLIYLDSRKGILKQYTEKDGLPSNTLLNALKDDLGQLWISTYNGLSKFTPETGTFHNFYQSDGLQSNQFNYNAALKLSNGEMAFGGIRGFNIFHPSDIHFNIQPSPLVLTQLQIDNKPYSSYPSYSTTSLSSIKELEIPYHKAVLSFSFAALEYTFAEKIKYAYFLEGWDKGWNYVNKQRTAHYSHLKEGQYTLRIKSTDANGKWNTAEYTIRIRILPPWYRIGWAYALYAFIALAALYLYIRHIKNKTKLLYKLRTTEFERDKEHELNEKKITFFTHIAHEFRTPLTLIVNPLKDMLYQPDDTNIDHAGLQHVYNNSKRLLSLVDKLLLFRQAESDFDQLRIVKLDFIKLAKEVFYCFQQLTHTRNINYHFSSTEESNQIYGDREKLEICLFNLFHNAIKFTADGGTVKITIQIDEEKTILKVCDSGNGSKANLNENIFKPFHRDYSSNIKAKEGFGIGLFLVKKFISAHRGDISFQNNTMGGVTFCLSLMRQAEPFKEKFIFEDVEEHSVFIQEVAVEENVQELSQLNAPTKDITKELTNERDIMLLVDDNSEIRKYICSFFEHDFEIIEADSGEMALEILKTIEPSIVISDVVMHDISGIDLCEKIKKNITLSHIPIILLTASFSPDVKLKGIEGGADDYITKPFDKDILIARVHNLIENKHRLHQYFHSEITLQQNAYKIPTEYRDFLYQAMEAVEGHLQDVDFSVKILADQLGMSHSNLYRRVKSISGKSVNEFIRYIRLRKVACLLIDTNMNINQAAYAAGFSDIKHFRQQFTKLFGCTPSAYRKKYAHLKNKIQINL